MLNWLFGTPQTVNQYSRQVYVNSSRRATKVYTVYGDTEVCAIRAMKEVELQLPQPEPGETVEIKTYLTQNGKPDA
ncbi:hypothetical protein [Microcoleus sp. OTE_8_concoct_300]|uniref:hypothetical protein n=1 Tax=Microcoleus sp. OTE_8_concoct_300 TaxID=2964710 RepID=UPI00403FAC78